MKTFEKSVGSVSLSIEGNESNLNQHCVVIHRNRDLKLRCTLDDLFDLRYLINRAIESLGRRE